MLVGGPHFARHRSAFVLGAVALFCLPALGWYLAARFDWLAWPSGTGPIGLGCGIAGAGIIFFEMLLWFRKKLRGWRLGTTRTWMFWHIWLGLLCLPLAMIHSGFGLGGALSASVMILFLIVIASGVWGLLMQQTIPRKLLDEIPGESIVTEGDRLMKQHLAEAEELIERLRHPDADSARETAHNAPIAAAASSYRTSQLVLFFETRIVPYLMNGRRVGGPLAARARALSLFADLRRNAEPRMRSTVERLEAICEARRQLDVQTRLHFWLHNWLCVHAPLSWALTILLVAHAIVALKLW